MQFKSFMLAVCGLLAFAVPAGAIGAKPMSMPQGLAAGAEPVAHRSCGLRIDGKGPAARCPRYEQTCLRDANPGGRCGERRAACTSCGEAFARCEARTGHLRGLLSNCDKCVAAFRRCQRNLERRLPIHRP